MEDPRCSASKSGTSSTWPQARHSASASSGRQSRVAVFEHDSQCVFIAGLAWHQPQRDAVESCDRHIEGHAHGAQGAPHSTARTCRSAAVSPAKNRTGKPEGSSRRARPDPAHPPLRIDASKLSRARLLCRVTR